ncbi:MAG: ATP-dependent DNA ligase [Planctomycetes bacterium]|nr:ATP-dependent DNA ligase [Planctomycetota bacterium]
MTMARDSKVAFTHLDKVYYPDAAFTKGDMMHYYQSVGPTMLPHLAKRPVTVIRYPDGVAGGFFFEKRCPEKRPAFMKTVSVTSERYGTIAFCAVDNLPSLLWLANRAAIEFHTYLFRGARETAPTMMVFDLDPGAPATIADCVEIALIIRGLLRELGLECFAKTSGGKGLHLGVPVQGTTFAATKAFARGIATTLERREPLRVTASMAKAARAGRVFFDWSQNDHGKTTACAYTLRARRTPTVSTPVAWDELELALRRKRCTSLSFTAAEVLARVARLGDLFAPALTLRQRLPAVRGQAVATSHRRGPHASP